MIFYHGHADKNKMKKIREVSELLNHGVELAPARFYDIKDERWIFDNGAFTSDFKPRKWINSLEKIKKYDNKPEFVVLPDVFDDPVGTIRRHWKYVSEVRERGLSYYSVAQMPMTAETAVKVALGIGADGIFVGGSWIWKKNTTEDIVNLAHQKGLKVHIGMPKNYLWAWKTGADSMDSSNMSRNTDFSGIKNLEGKIRNQREIEYWY